MLSLYTYVIHINHSGTEKQHVADDYAHMLHNGEVECREVVSTALNAMLTKKSGTPMNLKFCEYLNISVCPSSENGSVSFCFPFYHRFYFFFFLPIIVQSGSIQPSGQTIPTVS